MTLNKLLEELGTKLKLANKKKLDITEPVKLFMWFLGELVKIDADQRFHCLGCETILCVEDLREKEDRRVCDNCEEDAFVIFTDGGKYHQNLRRKRRTD